MNVGQKGRLEIMGCDVTVCPYPEPKLSVKDYRFRYKRFLKPIRKPFILKRLVKAICSKLASNHG
jgi:hypothetical protein